MRTISKLAVYSLLTSVLFSACSRPYATYQKMPVERFGSRQDVPATVSAPQPVEEKTIASIETPAVAPSEETAPLTTAAALTTVEQKLQEAVASQDNKLVGNKKLEKRMARVQKLLAEAKTAPATEQTTASASSRKLNLAERMMMKKIDKKIKKSMAPDEVKQMSQRLKIGIVVGVIGLILAIIGIPVLSLIGVIMLVVGLVLILLEVLANG